MLGVLSLTYIEATCVQIHNPDNTMILDFSKLGLEMSSINIKIRTQFLFPFFISSTH